MKKLNRLIEKPDNKIVTQFNRLIDRINELQAEIEKLKFNQVHHGNNP